jgi:hypothetical protein
MLREWRWRDVTNILLGVWLLATPLTFDIFETATIKNDVICGALVVGFACLTLLPRFDLARWGICLIGIWLLFAPLVFWTREPGIYAMDTLVGALLITCSVLVPMMPGRAHHRVMTTPGPDTPPGWSYNPSAWMQRGPIIAMAFVGFLLSRHLAAYQLGHTSAPWEPFFGSGTKRVLESDISKAWPIADAGLGAVSYLIEALSGFMGGRNRWRTMPWMVVMFGVLVVPLGVVSLVLVVLQPIAVGAWCALCLLTAAAMLIMISPAIDEVVAMSQFLSDARREGQPFWRTFWVGGTLDAHGAAHGAAPEAAAETAAESRGSTVRRILAAMDLTNVPWNLLIAAAAGIWLMAAPAVLDMTGPAADNGHLAGALVVTFAVIAFAEIARPVRLLIIPIALWLIAAPWMLAGATPTSQWSDMAIGAALVALSLRRGRIDQRFGRWNKLLI